MELEIGINRANGYIPNAITTAVFKTTTEPEILLVSNTAVPLELLKYIDLITLM